MNVSNKPIVAFCPEGDCLVVARGYEVVLYQTPGGWEEIREVKRFPSFERFMRAPSQLECFGDVLAHVHEAGLYPYVSPSGQKEDLIDRYLMLSSIDDEKTIALVNYFYEPSEHVKSHKVTIDKDEIAEWGSDSGISHVGFKGGKFLKGEFVIEAGAGTLTISRNGKELLATDITFSPQRNYHLHQNKDGYKAVALDSSLIEISNPDEVVVGKIEDFLER